MKSARAATDHVVCALVVAIGLLLAPAAAQAASRVYSYVGATFVVNSGTRFSSSDSVTATFTLDCSAAGGSGDCKSLALADHIAAVTSCSFTASGSPDFTITCAGLDVANSKFRFATDTNGDIVASSYNLVLKAASGEGKITTSNSGGFTNVYATTDYVTYSAPGVWTSSGGSTPPTVTSINPTSGTALGGIHVTITGTDFTGATAVKFGTADAASFSVTGATSITATAPAGSGTVDVTVTTSDGTSATSAADRFTYFSADSSVSVVSSLNPSEHGQMVIFTATVTAASTPTGTITFKDGTTVLGSTTLDGLGQGKLGTSSLSVGVHSITVTYNGDSNFSAATSPALTQTVSVPADSVKVEQVQNQATLVVAQASGQAITGAIEDGIADGFGGGEPVSVGPNGLALNYAADPGARHRAAALTALGYVDGRTGVSTARGRPWNLWASLRGTGWDGHGVAAGIDGLQINATGGIGMRLTPDLLLGIVGGYERFSYDVSALGGRLAGNGGSAGAYLAWRFGTGLEFNAAAVWSGLAYKATAGSATGSFSGNRWLVSAGLAGSQRYGGFVFQPSARVYALWEREGAWTDSLATAHPPNRFASGRASLGGKLAYTWRTPAGNSVTPYVGAYGDYRFSSGSATVGSADVTTDRGWSARVQGGVNVASAHGAALTIDGELGGFGSHYLMWSAHARAGVNF